MFLLKNQWTFGGVEELLAQGKTVGEVAFLKKGDRYVYYLITKKWSRSKSTYKTMKEVVKSLKKLCIQHNINKLAMPYIGCGLDKLKWSVVKLILKKEFKNCNIKILIKNKT